MDGENRILLETTAQILSIYGKVIDRNSQNSIAGARVEIVSRKVVGISNPDGIYCISDLAVPGNYDLRISARGYEPCPATVSLTTANVPLQCDIELTRVTQIAGRVINSDDKKPISGAAFTIDGEGSDIVTDSWGIYRIKDVKPGDTVTVQVSAAGYSANQRVIEVKAGRNIVNIQLEQE